MAARSLMTSTSKMQQTFVMRSLSYPADEVKKLDGSNEGAGYAFGFVYSDYHFALIKACIVAAGGNVLDAHKIAKQSSKKDNNPFTRDYAVALEYDANKILLIPKDFTKAMDSSEVLSFIPKHSEYKLIEVEKSYFEGGNIFFIPQYKLFIHGANPVGDYHKYVSDYKENDQRMQAALKTLDINFISIELSDTIKLKNKLWTEYYYHLDCFMQFLPDGRLIILNKKMLSPESCKKLEEIFKDKFIDLQYENYMEKPVLLNFIFLQNEKGNIIVSPSLPESVVNALAWLNLRVFTPNVLNPTDNNYDKFFCERVAAILKAEGFEDVDPTKLLTYIPRKKEYLLNNGEKLTDKNLKDLASGYMCRGASMSEIVARGNLFNFRIQFGGPHCLTLEFNGDLNKPNNHAMLAM